MGGPMEVDEPTFGEEVLIPRGRVCRMRGTVQEVYGRPERRYVVVLLTPEKSNYMVHEPTTVTWPLDGIQRVQGQPSNQTA